MLALILGLCTSRAFSAENIDETSARRAEVRAMTLKNLKRLKSRHIIGLEFIEAGPGSTAAESRWGHALLRFVDDDADNFNDLIVGFIADVDDATIRSWKGLSGGYRATMEMTTIGNYIQFYNRDQGRTLTRHIITGDPAKIARLIALIERYANDPSFAGKYYFIQRNCAVILQSMLTSSGFPSHRPAIKPVSVGKALQKAAIAPYPTLAMVSLDAIKVALRTTSGNYARVDDLTLLRAYYLLQNELPPNSVAQIYNELQRRQIRIDLNAVYQLRPAPEVLYSLCESIECLELKEQSARTLWTETELKNYCRTVAPLWDSYLYSAAATPESTRFERSAVLLKNAVCR